MAAEMGLLKCTIESNCREQPARAPAAPAFSSPQFIPAGFSDKQLLATHCMLLRLSYSSQAHAPARCLCGGP